MQTVQTVQTTQAVNESVFDGGLLQLIGWRLLGFLVTFFTLGICAPWAITGK